MTLNRSSRIALAGITFGVLALIYLPLLIVVANSLNPSQSMTWPPAGVTVEWWERAWHSVGAREALVTSLQVAVIATVLALVLGTLLALALQRYSFFGKNAVNLLVILPIALPGVVTGIALNNGFRGILGVDLSIWTIVVAHATFCIVTVFNNVQARLRRLGTTFEEASADLGAGLFTTFRLVTLPQLRSALLAGGMLAFALSFDEIIVTTFTAGGGTNTLPIWILNNMFRPNQAPVVNVVAVVLIAFSVVPVWLAQRLSADVEGVR
ncbi:putative spermidine/putrescine transport system permease protein [Nocardioides albertanoniae]|uniref:Putative spermidine/putrescine transport system permease protein n=1 Tax=Nocardioides albertanoniae TaxID=1175486 RepID=A0A543A5N9_9ACTN|nr:ABC transporter permease [Nocardioides albertanoniae]TQL67884.1 putative spermidine/putrescine transport system permease protein [Nocardioides albertanoniae]